MTTTRGDHPPEDRATRPDAARGPGDEAPFAWPVAGPSEGGEPFDYPAARRPRHPGKKVSLLMVSGVAALGLGLAAGTLPVPYVVEKPGPTFNTLGEAQGGPVISVIGRETYPAAGNLDLTTVYVDGGPNGPISILGAFAAWLDPSSSVYPEELIYPSGTTREEADEQSTVAMTTSQENAIASALKELGIPFTQELQAAGFSDGSPSEGKIEEGDVFRSINGKHISSLAVIQDELAAGQGAPARVVLDRGGEEVAQTIAPADNGEGRYILGVMLQYKFTFPFDVEISLDKVGGPSAGMMFSLGIIDKLTPGDLTGGRHVAGTGEITPDGKVGPIGGISQKMQGARAAGATLFLAPAANCGEVVGHIPDGLQVVKVENLAEARDAVELAATGRDTSGLAACTSN